MSDKSWMFGRRTACEELAALGGNFAKAAAFVMRADLETLPPGRFEIDGERVFAVVNDAAELVPPEDRKPEVHERYYDIQIPLTGEETYGVRNGSGAQGREKAGDDLWFLTGVVLEYKTIRPGEFMVFAPKTCAHAPAVSLTGKRVIRKIVVKVLA